MPVSCHHAIAKVKGEVAYTFALAGNPNVGKSTIFNQLTGMGVVTANYPGKTVEVNVATTDFANQQIGIVDLPGTYALGAVSEDQWVARQAVLDSRPDVVVAIVDATNLTRNLYMVLQFIDLGLPLVIALNLVDQAERQGLVTDTQALEEILGVPVVPTVAVQGKGLEELIEAAVGVAGEKARSHGPRQARNRGHGRHGSGHLGNPNGEILERSYGQDIEKRLEKLEGSLEAFSSQNGHRRRMVADGKPVGHCENGSDYDLPYGLSPRALAVLLFEQDREFIKLIEGMPGGKDLMASANGLVGSLEKEHGEPSPVRIARERYGLAGTIASKVQQALVKEVPLTERLWRYTTSPVSGVAILTLVLVSIFAFLFFVGNLLSGWFASGWAVVASPVIDGAIFELVGKGELGKTLIWGFDAGIQAALAVGIPYVLTFYFMLAFLEDTGYLNSVAFLADRLMHRFGLHGRAIIPLVAGAGCNVPAIIGTRVLSTPRERVIASTLITLVPCSARTAVIIGAVSLFAGWKAAAAVFAVVSVLIILVGFGLNKIMPGSSTGLVMEMFPFRTPSIPAIAKKTWHRFKDFVVVAMPIVLIGSLLMGALYETGYMWKLASPLSPVVEGWLGLPAIAGLTLVFAVLRKELALQLLLTLAVVKYGREATNLLKFMNPNQIFVYALVNTIYIPCLATITVLARELNWKRALMISSFTIGLAVLVGGIAMRLLTIF